jgi:hypothetical protein
VDNYLEYVGDNENQLLVGNALFVLQTADGLDENKPSNYI